MTHKTYDEWFKSELDKFGGWEWTVNDAGEQVDAVLKNLDSYEEVAIKRMIDFFDKIDAPMLKEGNVQKLFDADFKTIESIIKSSSANLVKVIGENGSKAYVGLREKLTNIPLYKIIGAISTQRGIGVRRMKKLQKALGRERLYTCNDPDVIASVDGFDTKTAEQTVIVISKFVDFFADVQDYITIAEDEKTGTALAGEKICMTGFRDKEMAAKIEELGGDVQSSVSGKTTMLICKDPNSNSGKVKKARDNGTKIIGIDEFKELIGI